MVRRKSVFLAFLLGIALTAILGAVSFLLLRSDDSSSATPKPAVQQANAARPQPAPLPKRRQEFPQVPPQPAFQPPAPPRINAAQVAADQQLQQERIAELNRINGEIEAEKERQRQVRIKLGLMPPADLQIALGISRKLKAQQAIQFAEFTFMTRHWFIFERSEEASKAIVRLANVWGFAEFRQNLNVNEADAAAFAFDWLADLGHPMKCHTAVGISRWIRNAGLASLPTGYKRFVQEHPDAFARTALIDDQYCPNIARLCVQRWLFGFVRIYRK